MSDRFLSLGVLVFAVVFVMLIQAPAAGQTQRTPWGDPDLQGVYTYSTTTPMQRPEALGDKDTYTEAELAELEAEFAARNVIPTRPEGPVPGGYDRIWTAGERGRPTNRTSLVVDPPNGRIPPLTPEAQQLEAERRAAIEPRRVSRVVDGEIVEDTVYTSWTDLSLGTRCVSRTVPRTGGGYNHGIQIVQTPGYVVVNYEWLHDARIIPLDARPALDGTVRQWNGSSRGHWEGDTLVVHLTNFTDETIFRGLPMGDMEFVERFTRIDQNTVEYSVTVNDPAWTQPWMFILPLRGDDQYQSPEDLYEFACHEGNFRTMEDALKGSLTLLEQVQN